MQRLSLSCIGHLIYDVTINSEIYIYGILRYFINCFIDNYNNLLKGDGPYNIYNKQSFCGANMTAEETAAHILLQSQGVANNRVEHLGLPWALPKVYSKHNNELKLLEELEYQECIPGCNQGSYKVTDKGIGSISKLKTDKTVVQSCLQNCCV